MMRPPLCRNAVLMALLAMLTLVPGASPARTAASGDAVRASRLQRFDRFLAQTESLYVKAGARPMRSAVRFGYVGADLIDPTVVTSETSHVLERYASYRTLLRQSMVAIRPAAAPVRPARARSPEEFVRGVDGGMIDATAAIERVLAAGDVWLTPGRRYLISHTIVVPSHRTILSDGTGTILVAVGSPGFPELRFDPAHRYAGYADVIDVHNASDVVLNDFRIQTPIADPRAPQPLLHGIDVRKSARVRIAGIELRGFARAKGVIRVNSSSDVVIADNLIHASYTRVLTRDVVGIEIDEARASDSRGAINSTNVSVTGNFVFGFLLDPSVYLETSLRGGSALNDETTAIALDSNTSVPTLVVNDNVVADVGQGFDLFVKDAHFSGNTIVRTPEFGLKMGHGASRNSFDHFRIVASGIAAIVIYALPGEPVFGNHISDTVIEYPGAVIGKPGPFLATGIEVTTQALSSGPSRSAAENGGNVFSHIRLFGVPSMNTVGWHGVIACAWPRVPESARVVANVFHDVFPIDKIDSSGGCATVN